MSTFIRELSHYEICICGLDVLGSNIAVGLARIGAERLIVIDDRLVTSESLIQPPFGWADIGTFRSKALERELLRTKDVLPDAIGFRVNEKNVASYLGDAELVVNTFVDEQAAIVGNYCRELSLPCLRVCVSMNRVDLIWGDAGEETGQRNDSTGTESMIASALAVDVIAGFSIDGSQETIEYIPAVA